MKKLIFLIILGAAQLSFAATDIASDPFSYQLACEWNTRVEGGSLNVNFNTVNEYLKYSLFKDYSTPARYPLNVKDEFTSDLPHFYFDVNYIDSGNLVIEASYAEPSGRAPNFHKIYIELRPYEDNEYFLSKLIVDEKEQYHAFGNCSLKSLDILSANLAI